MDKEQDRIYVDKRDRQLYDEIEFFKGRTRKEQFLMAMAYGFKNSMTKKIDTLENFFLIKDMRIDDEALMCTVALHHYKKLEILANKKEVYKIAQEYARAGIKILHDEVTASEFGSYDLKLEKDLTSLFESIKFDNG